MNTKTSSTALENAPHCLPVQMIAKGQLPLTAGLSLFRGRFDGSLGRKLEVRTPLSEEMCQVVQTESGNQALSLHLPLPACDLG